MNSIEALKLLNTNLNTKIWVAQIAYKFEEETLYHIDLYAFKETPSMHVFKRHYSGNGIDDVLILASEQVDVVDDWDILTERGIDWGLMI